MILRWRVAPAQAAAVTSALQDLMVRVRTAPGCTSCWVSTDIDERVDIRYVSEWEREDDLQRQIRSKDFLRLAELLERASEHPVVEFVLPTGVRGLEYAEMLRRRL